jgi:hypothetical protein
MGSSSGSSDDSAGNTNKWSLLVGPPSPLSFDWTFQIKQSSTVKYVHPAKGPVASNVPAAVKTRVILTGGQLDVEGKGGKNRPDVLGGVKRYLGGSSGATVPIPSSVEITQTTDVGLSVVMTPDSITGTFNSPRSVTSCGTGFVTYATGLVYGQFDSAYTPPTYSGHGPHGTGWPDTVGYYPDSGSGSGRPQLQVNYLNKVGDTLAASVVITDAYDPASAVTAVCPSSALS